VHKKQTVKKQSLPTKVKRHVKLATVPHRENSYRPHAIRRYGLVAILVLAFGLLLVNNYFTTGDVLGQRAAITMNTLLSESNHARQAEGRPGLEINDTLNQAAYAKAQDMLAGQYWSHDSPSGVQPWKWFNDYHYNYSQAGENLARGFTSSGAVISAWLASPEHRANLLSSDYKDVGFAVVNGEMSGKQTTLVVAMYGAPAETGAVAGVTTGFREPVAQTGMFASVGRSVQTLPAAVVGAAVLLVLAGFVALFAQAYRHKLPKQLRVSWYHHHGAYKAAGMMSVAVIIVIMYSGGQI